LREVPSLGAHEEDVRREAELVASHTDPRDEPEGVGPAILTSYAEVSRRLLTQHVINEVAEAQNAAPSRRRRTGWTPCGSARSTRTST
jgi:hypothetical protein